MPRWRPRVDRIQGIRGDWGLVTARPRLLKNFSIEPDLIGEQLKGSSRDVAGRSRASRPTASALMAPPPAYLTGGMWCEHNQLSWQTARRVMKFCKGLTTWCMRIGPAALLWRWNMPLRDAVRTARFRSFGTHGFLTAGPLIVEW